MAEKQAGDQRTPVLVLLGAVGALMLISTARFRLLSTMLIQLYSIDLAPGSREIPTSILASNSRRKTS
jgi:hypothetical protein